MKKQDEQPDVVEEAKEEATTKQAYFFPNSREGLPFGGEFESLAKAEEANKKYLSEHADKEQK